MNLLFHSIVLAQLAAPEAQVTTLTWVDFEFYRQSWIYVEGTGFS